MTSCCVPLFLCVEQSKSGLLPDYCLLSALGLWCLAALQKQPLQTKNWLKHKADILCFWPFLTRLCTNPCKRSMEKELSWLICTTKWRCDSGMVGSTGNTCSKELMAKASKSTCMWGCSAVLHWMWACDEVAAALLLLLPLFPCLSCLNAVRSVSALGSCPFLVLCVWTFEIPASLTPRTGHTRARWK